MQKLEKWSKLWKRNTGKNYDEFELYIPVDIFDEIEKYSDMLQKSEQSILLIFYCITKIQNKINNGSKQLKIPELKELMGYNPKYKKIDYILKKDGLAVNTGMIEYDGNTRLINYDTTPFFSISPKTLIDILTLEDSRIENTCKLASVWLYILKCCQYADYRTFQCKIANSTLCRYVGLSANTITKYTNILQEYGYIQKIQNIKTDKYGDFAGNDTNQYTLPIDNNNQTSSEFKTWKKQI